MTAGNLMGQLFRLIVFLPLLATACALADAVPATQPPPITLAPPPEMQFEGLCTNTKDLENWLQITSTLIEDFQSLMNTAAAKGRAEMYPDVIRLGAIRDSLFAVTTPDCASAAQLLLSDATNRAVSALQAFANGDAPDLGNAITDINGQLDQVIALQNVLLSQMNAQFQQQAAATTAP